MKIPIFFILIFFGYLLIKILFTVKEHFTTPSYMFGIMLIFKNEEAYLEEWLDHHIKQGVDRFYMYCNDKDVGKYNYLFTDKYKKYVKLIDWIDKKNEEGSTIQRQAYFDCTSKYSNECKYLMMLDADEFIINNEPNNNVLDFLKKLDYNKVRALKVQRYNFGSNGHLSKPNGGVIPNYKKREKICSSFKTIANTSFIDTSKTFYGVHDFNFIDKDGITYNKYLNYDTSYPNGCSADDKNELPLVINHYFTKSYDEYINRCKLWENGGINPFGFRKECDATFKTKDTNINEVYDDTIILKH